VTADAAIRLDLELQDWQGRTVLGSALMTNNRGGEDLATAKLLVQFGAKVNGNGRVMTKKKTLLQQALEARHESAILFLIEQRVDLGHFSDP
jgi:hypothetical protein